jgi:hypothetical protein
MSSLAACAGGPGEEVIDDIDDDQSDRVEGVWELSAAEPALAGQIPVDYLGCPMGATITMHLEEGSADVDIGNLRYYVGTIPAAANGKKPREPQDMYAAIFGNALDAELSNDWVIAGYDVFGGASASASVMLVEPQYGYVDGSGCSDVAYGRMDYEGKPRLQFELNLKEGEYAKVTYDIEYFNCFRVDENNLDQVRVCDEAWGTLNDKIVGESYTSSTCPGGFYTLSCTDWDKIFGRKENEYTEADVRGAVMQECRDTTIMDYECC